MSGTFSPLIHRQPLDGKSNFRLLGQERVFNVCGHLFGHLEGYRQ